jgi:16S rRNA (uracil1498-N3)-methyltransferase
MKIRLHASDKLASGTVFPLTREQSNYLANVLRCKEGQEIFLFNNEDGEFKAHYKDKNGIEITEQLTPPKPTPRLTLIFAPVKFGKIDSLAQHSTELGISCLQPVQTRFTHINRINYDRLRANCIEAAEQTGRITVPEVSELEKLEKLLDKWDVTQKIIFCDDTLEAEPIATALAKLPKSEFGYAILIGPEGGFAKDETVMLKRKEFVIPVTMGKRLLRAETAALAALAAFQSSHLGDWNG